MRKSKANITYAAKKRLCARRIVHLCSAIARKHISQDLANLIEDHIIARLPAALMRRLIAGDMRSPMREAMKLTVPFFA